MYETFAPRTRKVLQLANQEAHRANHAVVTTAHLLLGLRKEGVGAAACSLRGLGIDLPALRGAVARLFPPETPRVVQGRLPLTPRCERALAAAERECAERRQRFVMTEHLLLAVLRDSNAAAIRVLELLDVQPGAVRSELARFLTSPEPVDL